MAKVGRPTKYDPAVCGIIADAAAADALGICGVEDVAKLLNVTRTTIYDWLKDYREFSDAFTQARRAVDKHVESALLKKAKGYSVEETSKTVKDGPKGTEVTETNRTVHVPPDTPAAVFWLKNRNREEWSDKQQIEVTGDFFEHVEKIVKGEA